MPFPCRSSVRRRPEPVQDSAPPWAPNSRPLRGPDSSWTEPGRRRADALLPRERQGLDSWKAAGGLMGFDGQTLNGSR
jgi:hypothetical protein